MAKVNQKVWAEPTLTVTFRIPPHIAKKLRELSESTGRSQNKIAVQALEEFFLCLESANKEEK